MSGTEAAPQLSKFEAILIRTARAALGLFPAHEVIRQLSEKLKRPKCLSPQTVRLLEQTLSRGFVRSFSRAGWRVESFVRDDGVDASEISSGRLWQRTHPELLGLRFSANTMHLLLWLVSTDLAETSVRKLRPKFDPESVTIGDRLFIARIFAMFRESPIRDRMWTIANVRSEPLIDLLFPGDRTDDGDWTAVDFQRWTRGVGASLIEAMQRTLRDRWAEASLLNRKMREPDRLRERGTTMSATINAFCDACEQSGRRDLAGFLTDSLQDVMWSRQQDTKSSWFRRLDLTGFRIADRSALYQQSTPLLSHAPRLRKWISWGQSVGFYDEEYAASQHFKSFIEQRRIEPALETAEEVLRSFDFLSV